MRYEVDVRTTYYETFKVEAESIKEAKAKALECDGPSGSVLSEAEVDAVREDDGG